MLPETKIVWFAGAYTVFGTAAFLDLHLESGTCSGCLAFGGVWFLGCVVSIVEAWDVERTRWWFISYVLLGPLAIFVGMQESRGRAWHSGLLAHLLAMAFVFLGAFTLHRWMG